MAFTDLSQSFYKTIQEVLISLVAIISILIFLLASALNIFPAVPTLNAIPAPTVLTLAMAGPSSMNDPANFFVKEWKVVLALSLSLSLIHI